MWVDLCYAERGRGHIANDIPCQDKTYSIAKDGVNVIALSDGAGSAKLSHFGAEKVTENIAVYLIDRFEEIYNNSDADAVREEIIIRVNEVVVKTAEELSCEKRDLACTLLLVAIKDDRYILMHCGDGVTGFMRADELKVATKPMNGEFANETVFITSHNGKQSLRVAKGSLNGIRAFVLMSDGSEACLYSKKEAYFANAVAKIINSATFMPIETVRETLINAFKNTVIKKTTDDCSIAFLVKRDAETSKYNELSFEDKCELLLVNSKARNAKYVLAKEEAMFKIMQHPVLIEELSKNSGIKSVRYLKAKLKKFIKKRLVFEAENRYCSTVQI